MFSPPISVNIGFFVQQKVTGVYFPMITILNFDCETETDKYSAISFLFCYRCIMSMVLPIFCHIPRVAFKEQVFTKLSLEDKLQDLR